MTKLQIGIILSAIVLCLVLFFGFDTKSENQEAVEKSRALNAVSTDINALLVGAKKTLPASQLAEVEVFEHQLSDAQTEEDRTKVMKKLSGAWFELGQRSIAGFYAEKVAEFEKTEEAWSLAGTTYSLCLQVAKEEKIKSYCSERAVQAFESAISINPDNTQHQTNLALVYTEKPPADNPMKGILMLIELNKKFPENVSVLVNLGRLGIKTNQFEKAVERLEKATSLDPQNKIAFCLLANAYQGVGNSAKAVEAQEQCDTLAN
jgi:tetratricopeptide (TPR) repeat protein